MVVGVWPLGKRGWVGQEPRRLTKDTQRTGSGATVSAGRASVLEVERAPAVPISRWHIWQPFLRNGG
ncbi:hypothetical protein EYF80_010698 [Liparis tanakae]|uniref:Uncharacterized protein n=1 Tax=Liparis tanakae TaxID=230148 RepID=A0A4Z2ILW2_9TELE|nr:hypothetical protein EYF80_010698 [Liparis tanakae]